MNNARALAVRSAQLYRSEVPHWTKLNPKRTEAPHRTTLDAIFGSMAHDTPWNRDVRFAAVNSTDQRNTF